MKELGVYFTRSKKIEVIFEKSKGRKAKDFHFSIKTPDPDAKPTDTGAKTKHFSIILWVLATRTQDESQRHTTSAKSSRLATGNDREARVNLRLPLLGNNVCHLASDLGGDGAKKSG